MVKRGSSRGGGGGRQGGGEAGGGSKSSASGENPNWPSKTGNPSGLRRGNAPPKDKKN